MKRFIFSLAALGICAVAFPATTPFKTYVTGLGSASSLGGTELLPVIQSGNDVSTTTRNIAATPCAINAQTGTTYTLVLGDANNCVTMNNSSANTVTIPLNASVAFPVGSTVIIEQLGNGATSVSPTAGVTLNYGPSYGSTTGTVNYLLTPNAKFGRLTFQKTATDTWELIGESTQQETFNSLLVQNLGANAITALSTAPSPGQIRVIGRPPKLELTDASAGADANRTFLISGGFFQILFCNDANSTCSTPFQIGRTGTVANYAILTVPTVQIASVDATTSGNTNLNVTEGFASDNFYTGLTNNNYSGTLLTAGPTGEIGYAYTAPAIPYCLGTNTIMGLCVDKTNQGIWLNGATGGSQGQGTINTKGVYVNGVAVPSDTSTDTLTNKRITSRIQTVADGTSITPTGDSADQFNQVNTQTAGTLTVNAPTGTPTDGQKLMMRIKSTNVQTYAWNGAYRGSTSIALPTASTGSAKTDYLGFVWNAADSKWDFLGSVAGF